MQEAVISGKHNVIDILLNCSLVPDNVDEHGHNLIFDAISNGSKEIINKVLSNKKIGLNHIDKNGNSILHLKSVLSNNDIAISIMESGADLTIKDMHGKNFLFYAAALGIESEKIIDKAINLGCNINSRSKDNKTILMEVLLAFKNLTHSEKQRRESLLKMVQKLIDEGIDITAYDNSGETALFIPIREKDIETISVLLRDSKLNINHQNNIGFSVLDIACLQGIEYIDIILVLLKHGANPNLVDIKNRTIVEKLIDFVLYLHNEKHIDKDLIPYINEKGNYLIVLKEVLQNSKVNFDKLSSKGKPYFFDTIFYRNDNLFKLLKQFGANINQKDSEQRNIIHALMSMPLETIGVTHKHFLEILQLLTALGVDVNSKDSFGGSTVHKAILEKCEYTVKILLDAKCDLKAEDLKGRTFVHNCVWKGKVKHFKLVHSYDQNILNKPDKFGILPINYAAFMGQKDLILEMISAGAFVNNTYKKNEIMIEFLSQFAKNLDTLISDRDNELDIKNLKILISNMKKEFDIK